MSTAVRSLLCRTGARRWSLISNLADRFRRFHSEDGFEVQPRSLIAGQMSRSIVIAPGGAVDLFGIRFQPCGAFGLFQFPVFELTDRIENVFDVWGNAEVLLHEQLCEAVSFAERVERFERFLRGRLNGHSGIDPEIDQAVLAFQNDSASVRQVAGKLGWSERRLERRFHERIGLSPKMFSRIMRFQRLVRMLETDAGTDLADAAVACGYYDQPHMNREFSEFVGTSPKAFLAASHPISELFVSGE